MPFAEPCYFILSLSIPKYNIKKLKKKEFDGEKYN